MRREQISTPEDVEEIEHVPPNPGIFAVNYGRAVPTWQRALRPIEIAPKRTELRAVPGAPD